jgi:rhodanese-related sulfurtransferase
MRKFVVPVAMSAALLVPALAGAQAATAGTAAASAAHAPPAAAAPAAAPSALARSIAPAELAARQRSKHPPVVLDVRAPAEYAEGHVPGAINVPHDQVESRLAELERFRDREVVVYCRSGRRAGLAAEVLQRHGFGRLVHLQGDMPGWAAAGQPVERP